MMMDKRILLVDDEETTRELIKEILLSKGYNVLCCEDGKSALDAYRANPFPVVITDIDMPCMDGNELISRLKEIDDQQVIIVLTIHSKPEIVIDIMRKGVFDYTLKPVQMSEFVYKVERAFEVADLKRVKKTMEMEKILKLERQLE